MLRDSDGIILRQNDISDFAARCFQFQQKPKASPVEIIVSDIRGQIVATLTDDLMEAGSHSFDWASPLLPSGVYIGRIKSNGFQKTIKMVLQN